MHRRELWNYAVLKIIWESEIDNGITILQFPTLKNISRCVCVHWACNHCSGITFWYSSSLEVERNFLTNHFFIAKMRIHWSPLQGWAMLDGSFIRKDVTMAGLHNSSLPQGMYQSPVGRVSEPYWNPGAPTDCCPQPLCAPAGRLLCGDSSCSVPSQLKKQQNVVMYPSLA